VAEVTLTKKPILLDPFLPEEWLHIRIKKEILHQGFPWHYPGVAVIDDPDPYKACFATQFYDKPTGDDKWYLAPSLTHAFDSFAWHNQSWLHIDHVMRCRANMYAPGQITSPHIDNENENRWSLLYYLNDADGGTVIDGKEYHHKENTAVFFDARLNHYPIKSTTPSRVSVNWIIAGRYKNDTVKLD
jgi:hypothetical protein